MKIIAKDLKHNILRLQPESTDDLWLLSLIIAPGDYVRAKTVREIHFGERGSGRSARIPMVLVIRVEHVEFQPFSTRLRVRGIVVEGPEKYGVKGKRHTINIDVGTHVEIMKPSGWPKAILQRLESSSFTKPVLIIAIDYDEYAIAIVQGQGLRIVSEGSLGLPGKDDPRRDNLLRQVIADLLKKIRGIAEQESPVAIVVAGPGFLKNSVVEQLGDVQARVYVENTSMGGVPGVYEAIRRGIIHRILRETSISEAEKFIDKFEYLLVKDAERIAYGLDRLRMAAEQGAIEVLVIVDEKLHEYDPDERKIIDDILRLADTSNARIIFVPKDSPAGMKIRGLGGMAAILRYPIPYHEDS